MTSPEETLVVLKVGELAPDFSAELHPPGKITLFEYRGKKNVILAFYPKDDTPGCTAEMCAFTTDLASFESQDTTVFGVSCDNTESHERFALKHNLSVALIADLDGSVGRLYGALREGHRTANRKLFLIDKTGKIRHIHDGMPENSKLIELLKNLK